MNRVKFTQRICIRSKLMMIKGKVIGFVQFENYPFHYKSLHSSRTNLKILILNVSSYIKFHCRSKVFAQFFAQGRLYTNSFILLAYPVSINLNFHILKSFSDFSVFLLVLVNSKFCIIFHHHFCTYRWGLMLVLMLRNFYIETSVISLKEPVFVLPKFDCFQNFEEFKRL